MQRGFGTWIVLAAAALSAVGAGPEPWSRPPDPAFPWQWSLENLGQPIHPGAAVRGEWDADVDGVEAHAAGLSGSGVLMALVGLGFEWRGSTLEEVLWRNPGEIPDNGIDDDGNGWIDDVVGFDFGEMDGDPSAESRHDLIVSEIAAAPHDGRTIAGLAPKSRIMLLKIADRRERILMGPLPRALAYASAAGARVIFMPWTLHDRPCSDPALGPINALLERVSQRALVIGGLPGEWPACHPGVVSVQPTDASDWPVRGPASDLDFAAPGSDGRGGVYASYAIGLVAGAAALLFEQDPTRTPEEVRALLSRTADRVHPELAPYFEGRNEHFGAGRINVARALGTDFDGDGIPDADDVDADGDEIPDHRDRCPLDPDPGCRVPRRSRETSDAPRMQATQ